PGLSALARDHLRSVVRGGQVTIDDQHARTLARQHDRRGAPVADGLALRLTTTHHDRRLAVHAPGHVSSFWSWGPRNGPQTPVRSSRPGGAVTLVDRCAR